MWFQIYRAVSTVETPGEFIGWLYVDADSQSIVSQVPFEDLAQKFGGYPGTTVLRPDGNPLQLSLAIEAAREVSGDKADNPLTFDAHKRGARRKRLLRIELVI